MGTHPIFESDFDCLTENIIREIMSVDECRESHANGIEQLTAAFNDLAALADSRYSQEEMDDLSSQLQAAVESKEHLQAQVNEYAAKMQAKHDKYVKLQEKYEALKVAHRELAEHLSSSSSSSSSDSEGGWGFF